jgi:phosphatidylglycerol---prolipoprotein diacylglyceryl transferase
MINFLHTFEPNAILLKLGPLQIHWYGFLMIVGGILGFLLILKLADKYKQDRRFFQDLVFWWVIGAVLGARIYYVIYAWELYQDAPLDIFKIWQGGLAVHGIIIGGFITTYIYARLKKKNFGLISDIIVVGLTLAQVIGRNGNYFNQEIFGKPTDAAWGIPISFANRPPTFWQYEFFHPTFLYEVLGSLVILGILLLLTSIRLRRGKWLVGNLLLVYLMLYSVQRYILEFVRVDYSPEVLGVRWAQLLSSVVILVTVFWLIGRYAHFKLKRK